MFEIFARLIRYIFCEIFKFSPATTTADIMEVDEIVQSCIYLPGLIMHEIDPD